MWPEISSLTPGLSLMKRARRESSGYDSGLRSNLLESKNMFSSTMDTLPLRMSVLEFITMLCSMLVPDVSFAVFRWPETG